MIDFGLNDINIDLGLEKPDKKKALKPADPKDPFGMNSMADDMKKDVGDAVEDIKKDIGKFKDDIKDFKKDILLIKDDYLTIKKEIGSTITAFKNFRKPKEWDESEGVPDLQKKISK